GVDQDCDDREEDVRAEGRTHTNARPTLLERERKLRRVQAIHVKREVAVAAADTSGNLGILIYHRPANVIVPRLAMWGRCKKIALIRGVTAQWRSRRIPGFVDVLLSPHHDTLAVYTRH